MEITGTLFDIKPFALHDGPGIRTTVFFKGCPLHCAWCHNPEGISPSPLLAIRPERCIACGQCLAACPESLPVTTGNVGAPCRLCGACVAACPAEARELAGTAFTVGEVMTRLLKDRPFFDESGGGVTFSGGDPLAQPDFLRTLLIACGRAALHRAVDTSGHAPRAVIAEVAAHTDLFLFDLKHLDSDAHRRLTGVANEQILANLRYLDELGARLTVRMPLIPGFNDSEEHLHRVGRLLTGLRTIPPVHLLPYHSFQKSKHALFNIPLAFDAPNKATIRPPLEAAGQLHAMGIDACIGG